MEDSSPTKRLAITDIDLDAIPLQYIFKILSNIADNKLTSVKRYHSRKGSVFSVAEFTEVEAAFNAYDICDGCEIEGTHHIFNLSFVPDAVVLPAPVEECFECSGFIPHRKQHSNPETMLESTERIQSLIEEIPEEIRATCQEAMHQDKPADEDKNKLGNKEKDKPSDKEENSLKTAILKERNADELDGFVFDAKDPRFADLYEDQDFLLDASNRLFAAQKESIEIVDEKRQRMK